MKRAAVLFLFTAVMLSLAACSIQSSVPNMDAAETNAESTSNGARRSPLAETSEEPAQPQTLTLSIDGTPVAVRWADNETVSELLAAARNGAIVVSTTRYGGFEQVGSLPQSFSRNDVQMTTQPGDIVLYSGDQLVVFFGSNTWSYTRLGQIEGLSVDALTALLDKDSTPIEIKL